MGLSLQGLWVIVRFLVLSLRGVDMEGEELYDGICGLIYFFMFCWLK